MTVRLLVCLFAQICVCVCLCVCLFVRLGVRMCFVCVRLGELCILCVLVGLIVCLRLHLLARLFLCVFVCLCD